MHYVCFLEGFFKRMHKLYPGVSKIILVLLKDDVTLLDLLVDDRDCLALIAYSYTLLALGSYG